MVLSTWTFFSLVDIFFFLREDGFENYGRDGGKKKNFSKRAIYCLWEIIRGGFFDQNAGVWFAVKADLLKEREMFSLNDGF